MLRLLYSKWSPPSLPPPNSFKECKVLITGATSGLGLEAAIHYVNLGASSVIITTRTLSRGLDAKATIESRTGKESVVHVRELNMDTLAGVKAFVDALKEDVKAIDIVLLNAGVLKTAYERSPDGWEETLQVNTLSTVLLGLLLLPWMRASPSTEGRVQHLGFVSSGRHTTPKITTEEFPKEDVLKYWSEEKHFSTNAYSLSKLFMMYGVGEIVKLAREGDVSPSPIINPMCPGLCRSDLGRDYTAKGILMSIAVSLFFATFAKSTEAGARTLVLAAMTGPEEHGKNIKHYGTDEEYQEKAARIFTNEAGKKLQAQVWKEMLEVFDAVAPETSKIVHSKL